MASQTYKTFAGDAVVARLRALTGVATLKCGDYPIEVGLVHSCTQPFRIHSCVQLLHTQLCTASAYAVDLIALIKCQVTTLEPEM
jgi:hypothetical protein